jgi:hypothetical protein
MAHSKHTDRLRANLAYEAARIIEQLGRHDYNTARIKAAQRLGCKDQKRLPSNAEIEQALMEQQQLFHAVEQKDSMNHLRQLALDAMSNLGQFSPRLTGALLGGSANSHSPIQLHLFADSPEQIALFLMDRGIPYLEMDKYVSFTRGQKQRQPAFRFYMESTEVEIVWFPPDTMAHSPLSAIDQRPEKRVSVAQLENIIAKERVNTDDTM